MNKQKREASYVELKRNMINDKTIFKKDFTRTTLNLLVIFFLRNLSHNAYVNFTEESMNSEIIIRKLGNEKNKKFFSYFTTY